MRDSGRPRSSGDPPKVPCRAASRRGQPRNGCVSRDGAREAQMKLRYYQDEALQAAEACLANAGDRCMVVLATGLGKTVLFAHMTARAVAMGKRVLIMAHRRELIS